ncbi:MAG: cysteine-rich CWC family protein [Bacteroidota bacterium]
MKQQVCEQCKAVFECGAFDTTQSCWCNELPKVISPKDTTACLCPTCLSEKIKELQSHESVIESNDMQEVI